MKRRISKRSFRSRSPLDEVTKGSVLLLLVLLLHLLIHVRHAYIQGGYYKAG